MPRDAEKLYWLKLHAAIGALAFPLLAFRVLWRQFSHSTAPFKQAAVMQRLTQLIHVFLLPGITVLIVTGPIVVLTTGRAIEVFTWFSVPSLTGEMKDLHETLEVIHAIAAKAVLTTVVLHVLGTLEHVVFDKQQLIGRMFGRKHGLTVR